MADADQNTPPLVTFKTPGLDYFTYQHLPGKAQVVSRPFAELAQQLETMLPACPQKDHCIQKLLEAKDCAVRAALKP